MQNKSASRSGSLKKYEEKWIWKENLDLTQGGIAIGIWTAVLSTASGSCGLQVF